jgi:dATP/dGTP diphosphohydrolase, N-terminal
MSDGRKDDHGKLPWWLLPLPAVNEILEVLNWAAYKKKPEPYGPNNWQHVKDARQRYYDAAMRHMTDWWDRYQRNPHADMSDHESGFHILAHAGCCVLFLLWFELIEAKIGSVLMRPNMPEPLVKKCGCGHWPNCVHVHDKAE